MISASASAFAADDKSYSFDDDLSDEGSSDEGPVASAPLFAFLVPAHLPLYLRHLKYFCWWNLNLKIHL